METSKQKATSGIGRRMLYRCGERIFSEGQPGKEMYVVESGRIKIFLTSQNRELTLTILKQGDFFGEMALLEDLPRSASAAAVEETRLIAISKDDFKFLIQEHPEIAMKVLGRFSGRLREADNLINLLLLGDNAGLVIGDLIQHVDRQHEGKLQYSKEYPLDVTPEALAERIGLTIQHVHPILMELAKTGFIVEMPDGIVVKKYLKLKSFLDYFNLKEKNRSIAHPDH